MMSWNGNVFHVTCFLWGESISHQWIPPTKASNAGLWCFPWCVPEITAEQFVELPVIWDAMMVMWRHCIVLILLYSILSCMWSTYREVILWEHININICLHNNVICVMLEYYIRTDGLAVIRSSARRSLHTLIARVMGPTWGPSGADRTQVGPMLASWTLQSG